MIMSTTPSLEGKTIIEYKGIVFGEVILGTDVFKDVSASFTNFFGGRSVAYEEDLTSARNRAMFEMEERAKKLGANAIVGIDVDYETIGQMLMVSASGTAVVVK